MVVAFQLGAVLPVAQIVTSWSHYSETTIVGMSVDGSVWKTAQVRW